AVLISWPALVLFMPFQPFLVSLVGFRGNTFFLPVLAIGARLKNGDVSKLTYALALMNLCVFAIGITQYFLGIELFFPQSPVTAIMYASNDGSESHHRIPATFSSAHAYAGTMLYTLPCLLGAWIQRQESRLRGIFIFTGALAAIGGILLASTRLNFLAACILVAT